MSAAHPEADDVWTLDELGIEQVDEGLVEDNYENRVKLRGAGYAWSHVWDYYDDDEGSTDDSEKPRILQVWNPEQRRAHSLDQLTRRSELLEDPNNPWSDYVSPLALLADAPAPWWVKRVALRWQDAAARGWNPAEHGHVLPVRCKSIKRDGTRCQGWVGTHVELGMCRLHLGQAPVNRNELYVKTARQKLLESGIAAADELEKLLGAELETVRLRAATEILDRIGVKGGTELTGEVTVMHVNATEIVRDRLEKLREARIARVKTDVAELVEGEVVE